MDDIVTLLRKYQPYNILHGQAADEIERLQEKNEWLDSHVGALLIGFRENKKEIEHLRKALALAVGELSTHDTHRLYSPEQLYEEFLEEAHRG